MAPGQDGDSRMFSGLRDRLKGMDPRQPRRPPLRP